MKRFIYIFTIALIFFAQLSFAMQKSEGKEAELIEAVDFNDAAQVTQLLEEGANPNAISKGLSSALSIAVSKCPINHEIVRQLLQRGAPANQNDQWGETLLHEAIRFGGSPAWGADKAILLLLDYKADVNAQNSAGQTPIIYAIKYNYAEFIPLLLRNGAHLNHADINFDTALSYAVQRNRQEVILAILSNKLQQPLLHYGLNNSQHVLSYIKNDYFKHSNKDEQKKCQKIGKALIIYEGFYTSRSLITRDGIAKAYPSLPLEVVKYIAACVDYKAILFPPIEKQQ